MVINYPNPFTADSFYYLPVPWLANVDTSFLLDLMDALLLRAHDEYDGQEPLTNPHAHFGHINFHIDSGYSELTWTKADAELPPLFTENSYRKYKRLLLASGHLRDPLEELFALCMAFDLLQIQDSAWQYTKFEKNKEKRWRNLLTKRSQRENTKVLAAQVRLADAVKKFTRKDAHWTAVRRRYVRELQKSLTNGDAGRRAVELQSAFQPYLDLLQAWEESLIHPDDAASALPERERQKQHMALRVQMASIQNLIETLPRLTPPKYFEQLAQNYTYWLSGWPDMGELVYRPRSYMEQRWPVAWLDPNPPNNGRNFGGRMALMALLMVLKEQKIGRSRAAPSHTSIQNEMEVVSDFATIFEKAQQYLAHLPVHPSLRAEVSKGLNQLTTLGILQENPGNRYTFAPSVLSHPPAWPLEKLALSCEVDLEQERPWLELFRAYGEKGLLNINQLKADWKEKIDNRRQQSSYLLTATDASEYTRYLSQRRRKRLTQDPFAHYTAAQEANGVRIVGDPFTLVGGDLTRLSTSLHMPQHPAYAHQLPKPRSISATQLLVEIRSGAADFANLNNDAMTQLCAELQASYFVLLQGIEQEEGKTFRINWPKLNHHHLRHVVTIDASHLHGKLAYNQPFLLMLAGLTSSTNLHFTCRFRLLFPNAGKAGLRKS